MSLYFNSITDLDNPINRVNINEINNKTPFFKDYYMLLYLHANNNNKYDKIVIKDKELCQKYGGIYNLNDNIHKILISGQKNINSSYVINFSLLILKNNWWCLYIEKEYHWDYFCSRGISVIVCPYKNPIIEYFLELNIS